MRMTSTRKLLSASLALATLMGGGMAEEAGYEVLNRGRGSAQEIFEHEDAGRRVRRQIERLNEITRRHARLVREGLARWKPGLVDEPLLRTRHFMNLAALLNLNWQPQDSLVAHLINEKLLKEVPWSALRVHLTAVILQAGDVEVMTDEPHLGMLFALPEAEVRGAMIASSQRLLRALLLFHRDEA